MRLFCIVSVGLDMLVESSESSIDVSDVVGDGVGDSVGDRVDDSIQDGAVFLFMELRVM